MAINWRDLGSTAIIALAIGAVVYWRISSDGQSRSDHVIEQDLEVDELADSRIVQQLFDVARSEVFGGDARPSSDLPGRRVFVCGYYDGPMPPCGTGQEAGLSASVRAAAADLKARFPGIEETTRLKIDFTVHEEAVRYPAGGVSPHDVGVYGYFVDREHGESWILPSEVLEAGIYLGGEGQKAAVHGKFLLHKLKRRNARIGELDPGGFDYTRIRTVAWAENAAGDGILRTYRVHAFDYALPTPDLLLQRSVWAADYLMSSIADNGEIRYLYDPTYDRTLPGYNLLRHGGTTYAILQAYERTGFEPYRVASEAAIGFLLSNTRTDERNGPFGGGRVRYVVESSHIKLGGAGLGLVMLSEFELATGEKTYREQAEELALYLVSQQKDDGEFVYFAPMIPGGDPKDATSEYYPGEAILGLAKQYALDGNPLWLETADRAARWLIEVRDAGKPAERLANDHWLMIAMSHLYEITGDEIYLRHSLALAQAVRFQQERHKGHERNHRDYLGGYYEPPRSTPAATRGEGLVAVLDTCELSGTDCDWVRELLLTTIQHELQCQYTPDESWWLKNPSRSIGAFHGGIIDTQIRNDYTQHNLSAVLGAERQLRRGDTTLPGGPSWKPDAASRFEGIDADAMKQLRLATLGIRGLTPWEEQQNAAQEPSEAP